MAAKTTNRALEAINTALGANQRLVDNRRARKMVEEQLAARAMDQGMRLTTHDHDGVVSSPIESGISEANFNKALQKMLAASGGKIKITSGKRSRAKQEQLWANALKKYGSPEKARKWVAPPGRSRHESGLAADLAYADAATKEWAHQMAKQYGLHFPMGHEPWHIEPVGAR